MYHYHHGQLLREWPGELPAGAVEVSDADAETMIAGLISGKKLTENETGYPSVVDPTPTLKDYETAVQNHIDAVARDNDYDSIQTCTKYAGFDNSFRAHAEGLLEWNAACWVACHTIMDAVSAGTRTAPTIADLIDELPTYTREA